MVGPIYIVTGLAHTGTTLMMKCLEAGGIPLWRSKMRNDTYEVPFGEYRAFQEMPMHIRPNNECVKVITTQHRNTELMWPGHPIKVVAMLRDTKERDEAYSKETVRHWCLGVLQWAEDPRIRGYEDLQIIDYNRLLVEPHKILWGLKYCGWPIDVGAAAKIPDPLQNHREGIKG